MRPREVRVAAYIAAWLLSAHLAVGLWAGTGDGVFEDVAVDVGLDFVHFNGMVGELSSPEVMGSGGALFDYDNDGDLDVYLVQGSMLAGAGELDRALFAPQETPVQDRLYRNDLEVIDGEPLLGFTDVTGESGLEAHGYGMGVAVADMDNDGWLDLYLTNLGSNELWRNLGPDEHGKVRFEKVAAGAAVEDGRWSTGASFLDYDRDGWLDLYIVNYVNYRAGTRKRCFSDNGAPDYCGPEAYEAVSDRLLRNVTGVRSELSFEDVTLTAGVVVEPRPGLGVVAADLDVDGWIDLYVANDGAPNLLWRNLGNGAFEERALLSGSAVNFRGLAEAGMGVGAADWDDDGDPDLIVTHLGGETDTLYSNDGSGNFEDVTARAGLRAPTLPFTSFGVGWLDFDNDGWLDLLVANGAVKRIPERMREGDPHPLDEINQIFRSLEGRRFEDLTTRAGGAFRALNVSRGLAVGDIDNDGDPDALITNNNGPVNLLLNRGTPMGDWAGFRLLDPEFSRDAIGARVAVEMAGQATRYRRVHSDGSYGSAGDLRVLVALPAPEGLVRASVDWPDGTREIFGAIERNRYMTLRKGEGRQSRAMLEAVPEPVLTGLEQAVKSQLESVQERIRSFADPADAKEEGWAALGNAYGALGQLYQTYDFPQAAAASYRNAHALARDDVRWPYYLGRVYLRIGAAEWAAESFDRVLALRPGDPPALAGLGQALFDLGRFEDVASLLTEAAEDDSCFALALTLLGEVNLALGDPASAAKRFEAALECQPQATILHHQLATAYRLLDDTELAAHHRRLNGNGKLTFPDPLMRELQDLNRSGEFRLQRGLEALAEQRYERAAEEFRYVISVRPDDVTARLNLGSALARANRLEEAEAEYGEALRLEPGNPTAHFNLGAVLSRLGDDPTAIGHLRKALDSDPNLGHAHINLANAFTRTGRYEEAVYHYGQAIELRPHDPALPWAEAQALARLGRYEECLARLEQAHKVHSDDLAISDAIARILASCPNDVCRDGVRALRMAQANFEVSRTLDHVETLAMAHAEVGEFDQAIRWQERAIEVANRAGRPDVVEALNEALRLYRSGRPSRRSFRW